MRKNLSFFIYFILSIFLIAGGNSARISKADFLSKFVFFPFIYSINKINSLFDLKEKNEHLSNELAIKTQKIVDLECCLDRIKSSDVYYNTENYLFTIADVVGYTGIFQERNLVIDKGIKDKISINLPVVSNKGIVGKIVSNSLNFSVILPLNHPTFKLGVMCKRSHLQGIMESDSYGNSYMNLIKMGSDIALGDTIVTSNISTIFPRGYPVGVITRLKEAPDQVYMSANLKTFIDPSNLDQVIILDYHKEKDYESEIKNH